MSMVWTENEETELRELYRNESVRGLARRMRNDRRQARIKLRLAMQDQFLPAPTSAGQEPVQAAESERSGSADSGLVGWLKFWLYPAFVLGFVFLLMQLEGC